MEEPSPAPEPIDPTVAEGWRGAARRWLRGHWRGVGVAGAMLMVLAGPYLLRPRNSVAPRHYDRRLVVMTPHHETIRREFAAGFARFWKKRAGQSVYVDWRVPGGTSEIGLLLKSEYAAAFQQLWQGKMGQPWSDAVARSFLDRKVKPEDDAARAAFLDSEVGIGVDVFFGGGPYDFYQQAAMGTLVAEAGGKPGGIAAVRLEHPAWFGESGIPLEVSGEQFRDAQDRWCGTCLSSFGIVFNRDVIARLGLEHEPTAWADLADPRMDGEVALADPGKSGSVTKAFEMLIQQQMRAAVDAESPVAEGDAAAAAEREKRGVAAGWMAALRMIQRIGANARYFTDSSTKIPLEVANGDAAAGMCIDYYGRATAEQVKRADGTSRVGFVAPVGGTSVAVDPIGMLRGAPDPELATAFIEFVLSDAGQGLWSHPAGTVDGPEWQALRRLPVRRDLYEGEGPQKMVDGAELPYEKAKAFRYEPNWTGPAFNSIRFLIRVMCVDTHEELRQAWRELVLANFPPRATAAFHELEMVRYEVAVGEIAAALSSRDKTQETRLARQLGDMFRKHYAIAVKMAREGR